VRCCSVRSWPRRFGAAALVALVAVAGGPVSAQLGSAVRPSAAPPAGIPPSIGDDLGELLNWVVAAQPDDRETFLGRARAEAGEDADNRAKLALLEAVVLEDSTTGTERLKGYEKAIGAAATIPLYAATAHIRCAELHEKMGGEREAIRRAVQALQLVPGRDLWVQGGTAWRSVPAAEACGALYRRLSETRLSYRFNRWLANLTASLTGLWRYLASMAILLGALRLLEVPFVARFVKQRTPQFQGPNVQSWVWGLVVLDSIALTAVVTWSEGWPFIYGLDQVPMLWLPTLLSRSWMLAVAGDASFLAFYVSLTPPGYRSTWRRGWRLAYFIFMVVTHLFSPAYLSLCWFLAGLTGMLVVAGCRLGVRSRRRPA